MEIVSKATREGFGEALLELGRKNDKVVVVSADLEDSTKAIYFRKEFPQRHFSVGIAEQDMVGTAVGLAKAGFIPFINSFAAFLATRPYDQVRVSVCYNEMNVKIVASHGGITVGPDGGSAQSLEDFAVMRALPNMTVLCPADYYQTLKAVEAVAEYQGPVYMRVSRVAYDTFTDPDSGYEIGKAQILREGGDAAIISCGLMLGEVLKAAETLAGEGVEAEVINMHTIKPVDTDAVKEACEKTGALVTVEEHQIYGGLGSAVSEVVVQNCPVPVEIVGVRDSFGESGQPDELRQKYGLTGKDIIKAVRRVVSRKSGKQ